MTLGVFFVVVFCFFCFVFCQKNTVKPVLSSHTKKIKNWLLRPIIAKCRSKVLQSILQYFRPSFSYHLPLRRLFCLFFSGRFRQVLLYQINILDHQTCESVWNTCIQNMKCTIFLRMWNPFNFGWLMAKTNTYFFSLINVTYLDTNEYPQAVHSKSGIGLR